MMTVVYCRCARYRAEIELGETRVRTVEREPRTVARLLDEDWLDRWLARHHETCGWRAPPSERRPPDELPLP
jgi:hypothetical protein